MSIENGIYAASSLISSASDVHNSRAAIYDKKLEIIRTPMVQEILHAILPDPTRPPVEIIVNSTWVITRPWDEASQTYHPNGVSAYSPEVPFDFNFATALCLIIQDLYPQVYNMPTVTMSQLNEMLNSGTWYANLQMSAQHKNIALSPAFSIEELTTRPIETLPVETVDPKAKKMSKLPTIAMICSIVSIVTGFGGLGSLAGIPGIVLSIIGLNTTNQKKKCIWSLILSIIGTIVIPIVVGIIGFNSMFGEYL